MEHPNQAGGMMLTGIGAKILDHNMKIAPDGTWKIDLVLEKQEFQVR